MEYRVLSSQIFLAANQFSNFLAISGFNTISGLRTSFSSENISQNKVIAKFWEKKSFTVLESTYIFCWIFVLGIVGSWFLIRISPWLSGVPFVLFDLEWISAHIYRICRLFSCDAWNLCDFLNYYFNLFNAKRKQHMFVKCFKIKRTSFITYRVSDWF